MDLPCSRIDDSCEAMVGSFVGWVAGGKRTIGVDGRIGWAGGLGGTLVFPSLIEMAFDRCDRCWRIFGEGRDGEPREWWKVAFRQCRS